MLKTTVDTRAPFCLYVVWHPECTDGKYLARQVFDWFHAPSGELHRSGLGIPVYYRTSKQGPPRPLEADEAQHNVVVALVDHNLVADAGWRGFLAGCRHKNTTIFPVPLHRSAYQLSSVNALNFLRVDGRKDGEEDPQQRQERRGQRLRRQLTEVCARLLQKSLHGKTDETRANLETILEKIQDEVDCLELRKYLAPVFRDEAGEPVTIFLSHAKADGTDVTEKLRMHVQTYGQLRSFYDESDLPIGYQFGNKLEEAVKEGGAMISVVTDAYASRPWCRAELAWARRPRLEEGSLSHWKVTPTLVVTAMSGGLTRTIPEIGNLPSIHWVPGREQYILDLLLLEVLLASYHRLNAQSIVHRSGRHVISWVPDPISVMELAATCRAEGLELNELVYPGHGISAAEREAIKRIVPGTLTLRTYEEAWQE